MAFDHERLDVYRLAVELIAWVGDLLDGSLRDIRGTAKKHLDEASHSVANNIAEGNGTLTRRPPPVPRYCTRVGARVGGMPRRARSAKASQRRRTGARKANARAHRVDALADDRGPGA